MLQLLTSSNSTSSRHAKQWLTAHNIDFQAKNISRTGVKISELKTILRLSENGIADLVATHSKVYEEVKDQLPDMTFNEMLALFQAHPSLVKTPILYDGKRLQIGFNSYRIRVFMPRAMRKADLWTAMAQDTFA